jgi:hypothetical protein
MLQVLTRTLVLTPALYDPLPLLPASTDESNDRASMRPHYHVTEDGYSSPSFFLPPLLRYTHVHAFKSETTLHTATTEL